MYKKLILASSIAAAVFGLTACGSSSKSSSHNSSSSNFVSCNEVTKVCTLSGIIDSDYTLDATYEWRLEGWTFVGEGNVAIVNAADVQDLKDNGVTLTIPAGIEIKALSDGVLVVTRGSKLHAEGTAANPITFSSYDNNTTGTGEWGGVILQGFSTQYGFNNIGTCVNASGVCNVTGEGGTEVGKFGGNDPADSSGVLKYVRIVEAGKVAGPDNEINGLTLQGVGYGTVIDYVQVHGSQDDGIEWFGGTVNATHLVLTNNDDDDIDYDEGYKGNIQFAFVRKEPGRTTPIGTNDPRGIEANSKVGDVKNVAATTAVLSNITIVGNDAVNLATKEQPGILLRGEVTTDLDKIAVYGFTKGCVEAKTSELVIATAQNMLCNDDTMLIATSAISSNASQKLLTPMYFDSDAAIDDASAILASSSAPTAVDNGSGFIFTPTNYIGAVDPDTSNVTRNWWSGWVIEGSMDGLPANPL